jgi:hypothetical protein
MAARHVVVDGSNLATEGRTLPSLQQLDDAVRAFEAEFAPATVTVVVDASFPNRIDDSEREVFEGAVDAGEVITPPAGVIGRGDAFLLQIADRADAIVLSNDSFQEFHGTYSWLFDAGRLVGGKPVPHVGWVFMNRSPVRGPLSRRSVSDAKKAAKSAERAVLDDAAAEVASTRKRTKKAATPAKAAKAPAKQAARSSTKQAAKQRPAPARKAELAASHSDDGARRSRGRRGGGTGGGVEPYNAALPFIEFVSAHPVGSVVVGEVERFASHGAYVLVEGTRCYLPLKHLADPPPRSAREVLATGTPYSFVVHAFDTPRRGVDLTIPGVVPGGTASEPVHQLTEEARVAPARKRKAAAKKAPARKKAAAKKAPARKKAAAKRAPARKKAAAKRAPARKKKAAAKKAPARRKKAAAKKAPARRKKAAAKKAPARKKKAAAKKAPARRKKAAAKRAPARKKAAKKRAPARKKAAAKRAPARKKAAKKRAPARKRAAKRR